MQAHAAVAENPFDSAYRSFDALAVRLQASETHVLSHSAVEILITNDGREVLRQLFQAHLDVRGVGDVGGAVVGSDEFVRERKRISTRRLMSVFGLVLVTRLLYAAREGGASALAPMDASLNLPRESYSHGVRRRVAELAGQGAYDRVVEEVGKTTGAAVPKRQAEELAVRAAVDFDDFYSERERLDPSASQGELLVITVDGKGIVMRPGSLTPQTQRAAAAEAHKLERRLTKGEKKNRKRMATVASVYAIDPDVRTPDTIAVAGSDARDELRVEHGRPLVGVLVPDPVGVGHPLEPHQRQLPLLLEIGAASVVPTVAIRPDEQVVLADGHEAPDALGGVDVLCGGVTRARRQVERGARPERGGPLEGVARAEGPVVDAREAAVSPTDLRVPRPYDFATPGVVVVVVDVVEAVVVRARVADRLDPADADAKRGVVGDGPEAHLDARVRVAHPEAVLRVAVDRREAHRLPGGAAILPRLEPGAEVDTLAIPRGLQPTVDVEAAVPGEEGRLPVRDRAVVEDRVDTGHLRRQVREHAEVPRRHERGPSQQLVRSTRARRCA